MYYYTKMLCVCYTAIFFVDNLWKTQVFIPANTTP